MNVSTTFATSLIFVVFLYLFSVVLTFIVPGYETTTFSEATPKMFFGWLWFSVFSLVQFVTTWIPIAIICIFGGLADIILKLLSNIWNAIPFLSDLFPFLYPGVTFQNSINSILLINETAYVTILSIGTELEWTGNAYTGYWTNQGAGLLGGLGYFASNIPDLAQQIFDDLVALGQTAYDDLVALGQTAYDTLLAQAVIDAQVITTAIITVGQETADSIVAEAEALFTLIEDKYAIIEYDMHTEGYWVTEYPFGIKVTFFVQTRWPDVPAAIIHILELIAELGAELLNFS